MHVARHTFAVLSIKKGIDVHLLSRLMGHSSIVITEKVYADYIQSDVHKEVRVKLKSTFGPKNGLKNGENCANLILQNTFKITRSNKKLDRVSFVIYCKSAN